MSGLNFWKLFGFSQESARRARHSRQKHKPLAMENLESRALFAVLLPTPEASPTVEISVDSGTQLTLAQSSYVGHVHVRPTPTSAREGVGRNGNDVLIGGEGNDEIVGGDGVDLLVGGSTRDARIGSGARDLLIGGQGIDRVEGMPQMSLGETSRTGDDVVVDGRIITAENFE